MSTTMTTAVERYQPVMSEAEQTTLLGSLAGYRGYTRDAYTLDLRQFTAWCWQHDKRLFDIRRVDIECFACDLEDRDKARATVARALPRSSRSRAKHSMSTRRTSNRRCCRCQHQAVNWRRSNV